MHYIANSLVRLAKDGGVSGARAGWSELRDAKKHVSWLQMSKMRDSIYGL
jgi:hypothetical protein